MISIWWYETADLNQLIFKENEEAIQSNIERYIYEMNFEETLNESSVEYAIAYEKLFHMEKKADKIMLENSKHKQRNLLA